jgi:hypothetical protein
VPLKQTAIFQDSLRLWKAFLSKACWWFVT